MEIMKLLNALPGAVSQGVIWGIMAIGVYITYRILDVADLTVDGSIATGGAVAAMLIISGCNAWVALVAAVATLLRGQRRLRPHNETGFSGGGVLDLSPV